MPTLRDYLLDRIAAAGLSPADISAVLIPISDPRVAGGEIRLDPTTFAAEANLVQIENARRDILIEIQPNAVDEQGVPIIPPPEARVVGWIDGDFRVVRGPGAAPYPFSAADLTV